LKKYLKNIIVSISFFDNLMLWFFLLLPRYPPKIITNVLGVMRPGKRYWFMAMNNAPIVSLIFWSVVQEKYVKRNIFPLLNEKN